ncbi:MAG: PD40 domain-containing protein [Armatimonadetes bacterium]|nr:PD40 domain-containing protein [Armatimonadota bacterium]
MRNDKRLLLLLTTVVLFCILLQGRKLAHAERLPGKIVWSMRVYQHVGHSHYNLWIVNADGTGKRRLTNDTVDASSPKWSPDGSRIAYLREDGLWVINADGLGKRRLVVSPKRYLRGAESCRKVGNVEIEGTFQWSPRGDRIAFTRADTGTTSEATSPRTSALIDDCSSKVFWVSLRNRGLRQAGPGHVAGWREDGRRLVCEVHRRDQSVSYEVDTGTGSVSSNVKPSKGQPAVNRRSPDGRWIAKLYPLDPEHWSRTKLHLLRAADSKTVRTIPFNATGLSQAKLLGWFWDNRHVLVSSYHGSTDGEWYYMVDTQTGQSRMVLDEGGAEGVRAAVWSPGFRHVLVATCDAYVTRFGKIRVYHNQVEMRRVEEGTVVRCYTKPVSISRDPDWYPARR